MRISCFKVILTTSIPAHLEEGYLYVSRKYKTAAHLCPCGCGKKVVTPIGNGRWTLKFKFYHKVTLSPSIGNWTYPCHSHYFICDNRVVWASGQSEATIQFQRERDAHDILMAKGRE